jgi:hypothetical protein
MFARGWGVLGTRRLAAPVLAALLLASACSTPSAADRRADLLRDVRSSIGRYVAALDRGDLAAADDLRCKAARLRPEDRATYLGAVVDELHVALGPLRVQELGLVNSIDGVTHVRVQLQGAPGPVYPALVREDGEQRLCGASIDGAAEAVASEKTRDGVAERSTVELSALAAVAPLPGFTAEPGDAVPAGLLDRLAGFVDATGTRWDGPDGRTISLTVVDLDSPQHAHAAQRALEADLTDAVTERFEVPSPAARAFRYQAGYQLLLQPPGVGSVGDYLGMRWGTRIALVYVVPLGQGDDHALALAVAAELAAASGVD